MGFDDFGAGKAKQIAGLKAIDDHTLEVKLSEPTGDLGWRMAMPATAPIPPNGNAPLGAAEGHNEDYGRFLVASGPYMFEGSEDLDFSVPADDQEPVAGYIPGRSITMVRNPSWMRPRTISGPPTPTRSRSRSVEPSPTCTTRCRPATSTTCSIRRKRRR